ncbi:host specificity protein J [Chromobacterium subtsugae]|uniref:host specificity protein J n=1 Tax=Chromobacterium subtsugae TaxID=251747 RepID=UPI00069AC8EE|nr:host specificity factor TipJ family phage tail protein [Chromobacterium subtsugae]
MAVTQPNLVHSPHPLTAAGRQVIYEPHRRNETLGGYLRRLQIAVDRGPLAVCVNGRPLPDWRRYRLRRGDFIEVRAVVAGGGAGKVLRTVAMVAVMVAAAYVAGPAGAALFGSSGMATAAGAAVMIGGSMLVNALLPPPMPDIAADGAGRLPGVFANVDTDAGREVKNSDGWVVRQVARDTVGIGLDLQGVAYYANDKGGMDWRNVDTEIQFRRLPDGAWQPYGGDQYGKYRLAGNSITPVRQTLRQDLPAAQYEIRVRKTSGDVSSSRERNDFALAGLRAYRQDSTNYAGQRRVGLKIKASSQLNGAVDELSAMAVASCPVWTGSGWATQPTTNPAWWYLWFARGGFDGQGRRRYGAGLPDARIDIDAIKVWAAWCDAKKLSIGLVLDRTYSIADVLTMIARCGRARYTWQTGKLGVIWDAAELPTVAVFGPANIRAGSFRIEYTNEQTADEVVVNFSNPAKGFELDQVRVAVPGTIAPTNPVTLDFVGCCDAGMAGREANLIAASQLYHRRRVSWETDFEGLVATRGDVVLLSHDLASWSYSGRLLGGSRGQLLLDRAVPLGASGWVGIRFPDGRYSTYRVKAGSGDSDTLQLRDLIPVSDAGGPLPVPDGSPDDVPYDWMWFYDNGAQPGRRVKIVDVKPSADGIKFTAIDDRPEYYAAESGDFSSGGPAPSLPPALGFLRLSESSRVTGDGRRVAVVTAVWPPLRGAINYQLKWRRAGGAWSVQVVPDTASSWDVDPGPLEASVAAVFADGTLSAPALASLTVQGHAVPPAAATVFQAIGEAMQITLRWAYPDRADLRGAQILASMDGKSWSKLADVAYPAASWVHMGIALGVEVRYQLVVVDSWGNASAPVSAKAQTVKDPALLLQLMKGSVDYSLLAPDVAGSITSSDAAARALLRAVLQVDSSWSQARGARVVSGQASAAIASEQQVRAEQHAAMASDIDVLQAAVADNAGAVVNEMMARASETSALATQVSRVQTAVAGNSATITQLSQSIDGVQGQWAVKVQLDGKGQNPRVAGIQLNSGAGGSSFAVLADSFQVALPDGSNPKPVFSVTRINGQPAVGVDGSLIADGTIVGRRVIALDSIDAGQINSRGLTIRDQAGSVVVDMTGIGAAYIKGQLTVGQIDTRGMTIRDAVGNIVVSMNGMDASFIRNLMVDTLQIRGEAVSKNDTRSITVNGWTNAFNYSFQFSCSDSGTLLAFADSPFADPVATLYGRNRSVPVNGSAVLVLNVNAGEVVTVGVSSPAIQKSGVIRYGCVLFRR